MLDPDAFAGRILPLFVPENSVIVCSAGQEIRQLVAVYIYGVDKPCCSQFEFRMKNPLFIPRIVRSLKPALRRDDISAAVAVDITRANAVSVALRADFMAQPACFLPLAHQLIPPQRRFGVSELWQKLKRLSGAQ